MGSHYSFGHYEGPTARELMLKHRRKFLANMNTPWHGQKGLKR